MDAVDGKRARAGRAIPSKQAAGAWRAVAIPVAIAVAAMAPDAAALINPNFTPIHLVEQSEHILALDLGPVDGGGNVPARLRQRLKGKAPARAPVLGLRRTAKPQADALRKIVGAGRKKLALLFCGQYAEQADNGPPARAPAIGLLHVEGVWFRLISKHPPGAWRVDRIDEHLQGAWAGGTDMLLRAVRYIQADPSPVVPVRTGATWGDHKKIGQIPGKVHGAMAVDLADDGRLALFVLAASGDRVFRYDRKGRAFGDITAALKLASRSRAAAWGDFNADGRLDLASWDGGSLRLWLQAKDGTFGPTDATLELRQGCLGLAALDVGVKGRAGLLVSTRDVPAVLMPQADGSLAPRPLAARVAGISPVAAIGPPGPCLVADLDGDHVVDVLQPCARGALFYRGLRAGGFSFRVCHGVGTGKGRGGAFLGDYDADGLFDVFVAGEERCRLWQNLGGGKFAEALGFSGEAAYIARPNAIGGMSGDINNDGRQDILILYADRPPQLFFNRGFRSFGHSHTLDLAERHLVPASLEGQRAGLLADLDGDGGQDMALVLTNGEVWVVFRDVDEAPALCVRAALAARGGFAGPLTVTGWREQRPLGAWNVVAGTREAFLAASEPGPCIVRWQLPGRRAHERAIILEGKPIRLLLDPSP